MASLFLTTSLFSYNSTITNNIKTQPVNLFSAQSKLLGGWRPIQADQEPRRRIHHPKQLPSRFWDRLPGAPLTLTALRELDSRKAVKHRRKRKRVAALRANVKLLRNPMQDVDVTDLRGYPNPLLRTTKIKAAKLGLGTDGIRHRSKNPQDGQPPASKPPEPNIKHTIHYDAAFKLHILHQGVFAEPDIAAPGPRPYRVLPKNLPQVFDLLDSVSARLDGVAASQADLDSFAAFVELVAGADTHSRIGRKIIPLLEGSSQEGSVAASYLRLDSFAHLTDGTLPAGHADRLYGSKMSSVKNTVLDALFNYIVPGTRPHAPIAPNFFLEALVTDDDADVSLLQSLYHGMLGERAILKLRAHDGGSNDDDDDENEDVLDGDAHTVVATYQAGQLEFRILHAVSSPAGGWMYIATQLYTYVLTASAEDMFTGFGAYCALRRWAMERRQEAIAIANGEAEG
ncbi:hypothetical protein CDD81_5424 [Ophiocordyceps australis]|uniref:Uncharacterized protein n=1 Tax=Ophiocordyceps australis TaxID=1399860 RepID=A0A2C5Y594_9HYPO|nr:hypothetical protein CDD81_5424 [Ophiocordyceps australis]